VVWFYSEFINHRDTEDTEVAQSAIETFCAKPLGVLRVALAEELS
jgi:hypothetical protein